MAGDNLGCTTKTATGNKGSIAGLKRVHSGDMNELVAMAKALSDENRVRILMFLRDGELCVCQIIEMLGLAPSTISEHMAVLHRAGLVSARKEGRWIFYRLADRKTPGAAGKAIAWAEHLLAEDRVVRNDIKRLKMVKRIPVRELCKCYGP